MTADKKKKIWKIAGISAGSILVLLLISVFVLNLIVKHSVQTAAPLLLQTDVTIGKVNFLPFAGIFELGDIHVGNPKNTSAKFRSKELLSIGKIHLDIRSLSILSDKIVIRHLTVKGLDVYYEPTAKVVESNISILNDNMKRLSGDSDPEKTENKKNPAARKLQVDALDLEDMNMHIVLGGDARLPLANVNLVNLGTGPEGITVSNLISEVCSQIWSAVCGKVSISSKKTGNFFKSLFKRNK